MGQTTAADHSRKIEKVNDSRAAQVKPSRPLPIRARRSKKAQSALVPDAAYSDRWTEDKPAPRTLQCAY